MADNRQEIKLKNKSSKSRISKKAEDENSNNDKIFKKEVQIKKTLFSKYPRKISIISTKIYLYLFLFITAISITKAQRVLVSKSSIVSMKFNRTGSVTILNPSFAHTPNRIYINTVQSSFSNTIEIQDMNDEIKLEWDDSLNTCSYMFSNLINAVLIDMTGFDSSQVKDTSYMFNGCTVLTSINLDNFVTSSVINMQCMFKDDITLYRIDV